MGEWTQDGSGCLRVRVRGRMMYVYLLAPSLNRGQFLKADTNGAVFISCQYSLPLNVVFNVFNILDKTFSRSKRLFRAPRGQRQ